MLQQEDHTKIRASENPTIGSFGGEGNNPLDFTPELQTIKNKLRQKEQEWPRIANWWVTLR